MKTKMLKRLCLCVGLATLLASPALHAQVSLDFVRFQSENVSNSDLDYINIEAQIIDTGSGVCVGIFNNTEPTGSASPTMPTVASIYFDASSMFLTSNPTFKSGISSPGVDFEFGRAPSDLPGGNEIGFSADSNFTATPPPPKNGLNPGEFAFFNFEGADFSKVIQGVNSGEVRFGVHILQVGPDGEDSISMVTIPEPSAALLGAIGMLALLRRRRC